MCNISEQYIKIIVTKVASHCNLKDFYYALENFESIGQNYFGIIIPVIITGKNEQLDVIILRAVLKLAPTDERYRISGAVTLMFNKEVFIYSTLLSKYQELQQNFSAVSQFVIPKCFYTCNEYCKEAIVMQNLCEDGYRPFINEQFLDFNHITASLKSLAKLHALSFILKEKDEELYNEVTKECLPLTEKNNKRYLDIMKDRLTKALQKFTNTHVPLLENLKQNCDKYFDDTVEFTQGKCICHGDIWKENILFKYKNNKPESACLIDYQTARLSSPAFDVLYLIISSTHTNLRRKRYDSLLDIYHQMFDQVLNEVGLSSEILYSRQQLNADLKVVAPACFITANTALWLSNGLQEEGHVKSKHIWTTDEDKQKALDQYKETVKAIMDDFYIYGFFS